jgi:hypothetical protein
MALPARDAPALDQFAAPRLPGTLVVEVRQHRRHPVDEAPCQLQGSSTEALDMRGRFRGVGQQHFEPLGRVSRSSH